MPASETTLPVAAAASSMTSAAEASTTVESAPAPAPSKPTAPEAASGEMMPSVVPKVTAATHDELPAVVRTVVSIIRPGVRVVAAVSGVTARRIHGASV